MSPDILPGLAAGASAPPPQTGPAATGPPGDVGLSALFASLLAQSGGPQPKASVIPRLLSRQTTPASLPRFTLPIKAAPTKTEKLGLIKLPPPPIAGVTAETQNAMDTVPVSGPPKAKASETKPGGELPLPEARTIPPAASPAPPVLFIDLTPRLAATTPKVVKQSEPVATSQAVTGTLTLAVALPAPVALPSVVPTLPIQTQSVPVVIPPGTPAAVPTVVAVVNGETPAAVGAVQIVAAPGVVIPVTAVPTVPPALPKTFTLPVAVPQTAAAQPKPAAAVAAVEPTSLVKTGEAPSPLPDPSPKAEKAPPAFLPVPKTADVAAKMPEGLNAPRPSLTLSVPAPTQAGTATLQAFVMAAVPIRQSQPTVGDVPSADKRMADVSPSAEVVPQTQATKISLKSLPSSADNNTRTQTPTASRPAFPLFKPEGATRPFERPVTKVGEGGQELQEAAVAGPAQAPAVVTQTLAASPAPLTRPDRAEVIRQVADAVGTMPVPARPGTPSQMTLQLHPKDWGQLQISVRIVPADPGSITQAQTVTAHVVAASPQIKAALESGSGDLRHTLRQAGLHLDKLIVTVQAPSSGHHLRDGGSGGQSQPDARASGNSPQAGGASFASFTGTPQGGREGGQQAPFQPASYEMMESVEEPAAERDTPRRTVPGQVDMRA